MKSLTALEAFKLKSVLTLLSQIQTTLQSVGLPQSSINQYIFQLLQSALVPDATSYTFSEQDLASESLMAVLISDGSSVLKKLKKLQLTLYLEKSALNNGQQATKISKKPSDNPVEKAKKQKKDKKEKDKQKNEQKNNENMFSIFVRKNSNLIPAQQIYKQELKPNPSLHVFKPLAPLQQSSLFNFNIFGASGVHSAPSAPIVNIFANDVESEFSETSETLQTRPSRLLDQRDDLRKNIRQIQMYKQFAERQLMMKLLGQEEGDDMDTIDLDGMASFMLGR